MIARMMWRWLACLPSRLERSAWSFLVCRRRCSSSRGVGLLEVSPRLEAWVLGLPRIGPLVADHRSGLGMPRRAKRVALSMIAVFVGLSFWAVGGGWVRWVILAAGVLGAAYVGFRVPTKERVAGS